MGRGMGTAHGPGGATTAPPGLVRRGHRARRLGLAIALTVAAVLPMTVVHAAGARAADPPTYPGTVHRLTHVAGDKTYPSIVYVPTTYDATRPTPLVVLTHGCQTTAEQQMHASLYNAIAEREGFVVLHPDVDAGAVSQPGPLRRCWRWFMPDGRQRGTGDAAAIAAMTRAAMDHWNIDPERTYMVGMSAGGFMTSIMSAAYPDLYAAVGVMSAGAYGDALCLGFDHPLTLSAAASAEQAHEAMAHRARVVPRIVIGGDVDGGIPLACQQKAFEQGLRTNNLALDPLRQDGPLSLTPAETRKDANPGGHDSTVRTYRDPDGCVVGEHWIVHGMNHFWSGGTDDPRYANFTDPRGPNAAEATWRFFSRYTRGTTGMPCAEAPARQGPATAAKPPRTTRCARRWVTLRVPSRTTRIAVRVNGRRTTTRLRHGRLRLRLPATRRTRTVVTVEGRTRAGHRIARRYAYRGCGPKRR